MNEDPVLPAGHRLIAADRLPSTNDEAKRLAAAGADDGTVIWALEQTAGRGRRGRSWASPPGNLYCSILVRPRIDAERALQLGFVAAVATAEALESLVPTVRIRCKWPNDLLRDGRKIAGFLLESATSPDGIVEWLVVGIGVNLASAPTDGTRPAGCLVDPGTPSPSPAHALGVVCARFAEWRRRWKGEGFAPLRAAWLARAVGLGEPIEIRLEREETFRGRFADLDDAGALLLETAKGIRRVTSGDVFLASD